MSTICTANMASFDLNLLVSLDALLETRSVSRAARQRGLSQPAMSHALGRLRRLLGDPILVRSQGGMTVTPLAEEMRAPLRRILDQTADLLQARQFDPATSARRFHLMMSDYSSALLMPALLVRVQATAPHVGLQFSPWSRVSASTIEQIQACDAALTCHPPSSPDLQGQRLFLDREAIAIRAGHPLLRQRSDLEAFLNAPQIAVTVQEEPDPVDQWLSRVGLVRRVSGSVPQYLQALHMVSESDYLAVIPERLIRKFAFILDLKVLPLPIESRPFSEMMLHGERSHRDSGSRWLRSQILELARELESRGTLPTARRKHRIPAPEETRT